MLITGDSGVGKSELALELISRGQGLVADDVVEISRIAATTLEGRCPPLLKDFLEVRGLGLINIRAIYGETAVRPKMKLKLIAHLEKPAPGAARDTAERLPLSELSEEILGVTVRKVVIPVAAGRNLAVLLEAAVRNYILQLRGKDSAPSSSPRAEAATGWDEPPGDLNAQRVQLVLVSGLSGSGKSIALDVLEDSGYYCVDNLPATLLLDVVSFLGDAGHDRVAISVDARSVALPRCREQLAALKARGVECRLLFLEANGDDAAAALFRDAAQPSARRRRPHARRGDRARARAACRRRRARSPHRHQRPAAQGAAQLDQGAARARPKARSRCCSNRSRSATAFRSTPTGCSTRACCPTRTTSRGCGRSPAAMRR